MVAIAWLRMSAAIPKRRFSPSFRGDGPPGTPLDSPVVWPDVFRHVQRLSLSPDPFPRSGTAGPARVLFQTRIVATNSGLVRGRPGDRRCLEPSNFSSTSLRYQRE